MARTSAAALYLALAFLSGRALAMQFVLGTAADECFYEQVEASNKITGSFEVIGGGLLDVDVTVRRIERDMQPRVDTYGDALELASWMLQRRFGEEWGAV